MDGRLMAEHAALIVDIFAWIGMMSLPVVGATLMFLFLRNAMPRMWF